jgi:hypothetical protein
MDGRHLTEVWTMTPAQADEDAEEIAQQARRDSFWRGLMVGVALGIPATATTAWLVAGVNLLFWWL